MNKYLLKIQNTNRALQLTKHMMGKGKVVVKDKADNTIKESHITAVYADNTVVLCDCIHVEYSFWDVTIIP